FCRPHFVHFTRGRHPTGLLQIRQASRSRGTLATPVLWLRERALARFQVTGLSVPLERFSILVEGAVFATFFHEAGPRRPGERLAVFALCPSRTGALGDDGSNAEQQKQNRSYDRPAHFSLPGRLLNIYQ